MRPKIVILILVVAIGLVTLAALLKGIGGRTNPEVKPPEPPAAEAALPNAVSQPIHPNSSNTAAMLEEMRVADIAKELDQIRELQADGSGSEYATGTLLSKTTHREPEVRKAALEALVQLNDTNAIPGLEQAVSLIEDPREKVAFMDAVAYLKLPGVTDGAPPELANLTNYPATTVPPRNVVPNPRFQSGGKKPAGRPGGVGPRAAQPSTPANVAQPQPVAPAPDAAAPPASPAPDTAPPQ
jgi:hypothetical protein